MTEEIKRLNEVREQIRKLQEEEQSLLDKINVRDVLDDKDFPPSAKRTLEFKGVTNDFKLFQFLAGGVTTFISPDYPKVKTPKERLMCVRNIGERTAEKVMSIVEKHQ